MRMSVLYVAFALALGGCTNLHNVPPHDVALRAVSVVDPQEAGWTANRCLLIDGTIVSAIVADDDPRCRASRTIDGGGGFVIPGLWDMHIHLAENAVHEDALTKFVEHGVLYVRDMGGDLEVLQRWNHERESGRISPLIFPSGPTLNGADADAEWTLSLASPEPARRAVERLAARGVSQIKVYDGVSRVVLEALVEAAHAHSLRVVGHPPRSITLDDAIALGMDGFEHANALLAAKVPGSEDGDTAQIMAALAYLGSERGHATIARMATSDVAFTPTIMSMHAIAAKIEDESQRRMTQRLADRLGRITRAIHDAGVTVLAGTDFGAGDFQLAPGASLIDELHGLAALGLAPHEVLRTATSAPARFLGAQEFGRIRSGGEASFVLLTGNPLNDVSVLRKPRGVWLRGRQVLGPQP